MVNAGDEVISYKFKTQDGRSGSVLIAYFGNGLWDVDFDVDDSIEVTNKGDAFRILATVIAAVKDLHQSEKNKRGVRSIYFAALHEKKKDGTWNTSRADLYRAMLKRFAKEYGFGFEEIAEFNNVVFHLFSTEHDKSKMAFLA